jgi:hypothetical protein
MHLTNRSLEVKQIDSIYIWTDPLIDNANIMFDRQPLLSRNSLLYISIIRGTVDDAPYYRINQYDQQFRL